MSLNGDEKRIRQLFREMSRDDELRTPEFARFIAAAGSRAGRKQNGTRLFALAWAVAGVIAILIAVSFALRHSKTQPQTDPGNQIAVSRQPPRESKPPDALPRPVVGAPGAATRQNIPKRVRPRRHSDELAIRLKMLSAWQSPTASLLRAPGEEMLKSLPRLGESLRSIRIFSLDELN